MTNYNLPFDSGETTVDFNYSRWLVGLFTPSIRYVGKEEAIINSLLESAKFHSDVENVRRDFISNYDNLRKYPRFDEKDWR